MGGQSPASDAVLPGRARPALEPQALQQLLAELAALLEAALAPDEFHRAFLERAIAAFGARGGAVWKQGKQAAWEVRGERQLETLGLDLVHGWDAHAGLLQAAARRDKALWVLPHGTATATPEAPAAANLTGLALLIAPVFEDRQVVGLVEIWFPAAPDATQRRLLGQLFMEVAGIVAAFHHQARWRELNAQRQLWERLEAYTYRIHSSLEPTEVAYLVANESRSLIGCDQVAVALRRAGQPCVEAVSGAPSVDERSELVQALARLCGAVMQWGQRLVYEGQRDPSLPPEVLRDLDAYLARSNSRVLLVLPLEREAALVVEAFTAVAPAEQLLARTDVLVRHAAAALHNAVAHQQVPLRWLAGPLAQLRRWTDASNRARAAMAALAVLLLTGLLVFVPATLRMEAKGNLLPQQRQIVYAPLGGKVIDLRAQPGDVLIKGQEILFIEDLDTQLQADQLSIKIAAVEQRLAFLTEQLGKNGSAERQDTLSRDRIDQEFELRKLLAERDILLQASRTPRKAPVASPLAGKVVTYDAQETLVGKTVKAGDPLLRVAQVRGTWEVQLYLPESHVAPVREGLAGASYLDVDLLLHSHPHRTFKGRLERSGLAGETTIRDQAVVLPVIVQVSDEALLPQLEDLPVGVEVRAKIHCGSRSAGYVWFYEFWDFVYEHILF